MSSQLTFVFISLQRRYRGNPKKQKQKEFNLGSTNSPPERNMIRQTARQEVAVSRYLPVSIFSFPPQHNLPYSVSPRILLLEKHEEQVKYKRGG